MGREGLFGGGGRVAGVSGHGEVGKTVSFKALQRVPGQSGTVRSEIDGVQSYRPTSIGNLA